MRPNPLIPIWMGMVAFSRRLRGLVEVREVEKWQKKIVPMMREVGGINLSCWHQTDGRVRPKGKLKTNDKNTKKLFFGLISGVQKEIRFEFPFWAQHVLKVAYLFRRPSGDGEEKQAPRRHCQQKVRHRR